MEAAGKKCINIPIPGSTPTTKAKIGHDIDTSKNEIISKGLISKNEYEELEIITKKLFERGSEYAKSKCSYPV